MKIQTLVAALALTIGASAFAQAPVTPAPLATPKIDQRQVNQEKRIDKGIASGALSSGNAARLDKRDTKIASDKAAAKVDGKVTGAERRKLTREQQHASRAIKHAKHTKHAIHTKHQARATVRTTFVK